MIKSDKKIWLAILVVIVITVAVYNLYQIEKGEKSLKNYWGEVIDHTNIEWKTYKNLRYGFQIDLPKTFSIVPDNTDYSHLSLIMKDLNGPDSPYISILIYEGNIEDPDLVGPFPKIIPANEKNGKITILQRSLNGISGLEIYGYVDEGHGYGDEFVFQKGKNVWKLDLHPVGEGRIEELPWESSEISAKFKKDIYIKIRDSFKLI